MTEDEMEAYQATKARTTLSRDDARNVISSFAFSSQIIPCDAAVTDDQFEVGFEWRLPDGSILIIDLDAYGDVAARLRKP